MMAKRKSEPRYALMHMHDIRIAGFVVSTTCEGPECTICAGDPAAAKRANNPHFPHAPSATVGRHGESADA